MNRADLQRLSNIRIREAEILLAAGAYSGTYYLAGYAVECALKACFAKSIQRYDFPDKDRAGKVFQHKLSVLATLANLDGELSKATQGNLRLSANWSVARGWTEESRYSTWTKNEAEAMVDAISKRKDGVLPWIRRRW